MDEKVSSADESYYNYTNEALKKLNSETIKFFSSIQRVENYSQPEDRWKRGAAREHLKLTDSTVKKEWIYHSPKLSRPEFAELLKCTETFNAYYNHVMSPVFEEYKKIDVAQLDEETKNDYYIHAINALEKDWNFHRAFYKVFQNTAQDPMVYIDLQAFCATRHVRFLMRELFHYLEGNYVTTLKKVNKVYIPHLQFMKKSVELPYTAHQDLSLRSIIADYLIKEEIESIDELIKRTHTIYNFEADVEKEKPEPIFINTSFYIDRQKYFDCILTWLHSLKSRHVDFSSPENKYEWAQEVDFSNFELTADVFRKTDRLAEDKDNYESDKDTFFTLKLCEDSTQRWTRRLIREFFRDLIQYSINRYRIEPSPRQYERTEYEEIFRSYRNMTFHEKDMGCLLVEDGEISFVLLLERYLKDENIFQDTHMLEKWGLIVKDGENYHSTERAKRMAIWCMKIMRLSYHDKNYSLDFENKSKIHKSYAGLVEGGAMFGWMLNISDPYRSNIADLLGFLYFARDTKFAKSQILDFFKQLCQYFVDSQSKNEIDMRTCLDKSRFQKGINEWIRAYETINRSAIVFPVTTIPSRVEEDTRVFSIFIGSFCLDDDLDTDDEEEFRKARRRLTDLLNKAKVFFTLVGIPASEALSETIIQNEAKNNLEFSLGRLSHKVKNEGVNLVAHMESLSAVVNENAAYAPLQKQVLSLNNIVEKVAGTLHILNIASNGLKPQYMSPAGYCILDAVFSGYCSAMQEFFVSGPGQEKELFWRKKLAKYEVPLMNLSLDFSRAGESNRDTLYIAYVPNLDDVPLVCSSESYEKYTHVIDSEDILQNDMLKYEDQLPNKLILQSPFFEIFFNALKYMRKSTKEQNVLDIILKRTDDYIHFTLLNDIGKDQQYTSLPERIKYSPGIQANSLFFDKVGGYFKFSFKETAVTEVFIDFKKMRDNLMKGYNNAGF